MEFHQFALRGKPASSVHTILEGENGKAALYTMVHLPTSIQAPHPPSPSYMYKGDVGNPTQAKQTSAHRGKGSLGYTDRDSLDALLDLGSLTPPPLVSLQ